MRKQFTCDIPINEEKVKKTIATSKAAFLSGESEQMVSPGEFLIKQSRLIQKRWWFLQGLMGISHVNCFLMLRPPFQSIAPINLWLV